jgi:hypothetical protein
MTMGWCRILTILRTMVFAGNGVESPSINSILELFFGSSRNEALANLLLIGRSQIMGVLEEHIAFYKSRRLHQGIQRKFTSLGESERADGAVRRSAALGGLHRHYFRQAA